jgi:hypothetical protein
MYIIVLHEDKGLHRNLYWTGDGWSWSQGRARPYEWDEAIDNVMLLREMAGGRVVVSEE